MNKWKGFFNSVKKGSLATVTEANVFVVDEPQPPFVETDPTVPAHVKAITPEDIALWNQPDQDTVYTHPNKDWVDKTPLSNGNVISNLIVNSLGHITGWVTRVLTPSDIGAAAASHTHNYDNYDGWNLKTNGTQRIKIASGGTADFVAGTNVAITYGAGGQVIFNVTASGGTTKRGTVTITDDTILNAAEHDQMTLICKNTVDITITIPTGLGTDFDCNVIAEEIGTRWVNFVQGAGTTLKAPHGTKLLTDYTANITKRTGAEIFNLQGELTP